MSDTAARLLQLLSLLQTSRDRSGSETIELGFERTSMDVVAARAETSKRSGPDGCTGSRCRPVSPPKAPAPM